MPEIDSIPENDLGKGVLSPEEETELLNKGCVFAMRCTSPNGVDFIMYSKRPIRQVATEAWREALHTLDNTAPVKAG